jgi:hypothetical protein
VRQQLVQQPNLLAAEFAALRTDPGDVASGTVEAGAASFDHLVGAGKQRGGDRKAERLGSLQIDDKLETR